MNTEQISLNYKCKAKFSDLKYCNIKTLNSFLNNAIIMFDMYLEI